MNKALTCTLDLNVQKLKALIPKEPFIGHQLDLSEDGQIQNNYEYSESQEAEEKYDDSSVSSVFSEEKREEGKEVE